MCLEVRLCQLSTKAILLFRVCINGYASVSSHSRCFDIGRSVGFVGSGTIKVANNPMRSNEPVRVLQNQPNLSAIGLNYVDDWILLPAEIAWAYALRFFFI